MSEHAIDAWVAAVRGRGGLRLVLTGAGISAESGIPTFRGPEGYWRVGSRNYHPQELATWQAFVDDPRVVWSWYLYRRAVCLAAQPNPAHLALAQALEQPDWLLITQNVDGLHVRAGAPTERVYEVHGNIALMRCARECSARRHGFPPGFEGGWAKGRTLTDRELARLACPDCGAGARPHVLWFDETYDEERFRFTSSLEAAQRAAALIVVGTSGTTNLPLQVAATAARRRIPMLVVDPEPSPFSELAGGVPHGLHVRSPSGAVLPGLLERLAV